MTKSSSAAYPTKTAIGQRIDVSPHHELQLSQLQQQQQPYHNDNGSRENNPSLDRYNYYYRKLLGRERMKSDIRQLGGVILVLGIGTTFSTLSLIATLLEGQAGYHQIEGFKLPVVVANFLQVVSGLSSIVTGAICLFQAPVSSHYYSPLPPPPSSLEHDNNTEQHHDKTSLSTRSRFLVTFHKWCQWLVIIVNLGTFVLQRYPCASQRERMNLSQQQTPLIVRFFSLAALVPPRYMY